MDYANQYRAFLAQTPELIDDFTKLEAEVLNVGRRFCFEPSCPTNKAGIQLYEQAECTGVSSRRGSVVRWTGSAPTGARAGPSHHLGDSLYGK